MKTFCFDVETNSLDPLCADVVLCSYKIDDEPVQSTFQLRDISVYLQDPEYLKIAFNAKFEIQKSKAHGIEVRGKLWDPMVSSWLLGMGVPSTNKDGSISYEYGLKALAEHHLNYTGLKTFKELSKEYAIDTPTGIILKNGTEKMKKVAASASLIPEGVLKKYCELDVKMTYELYKLMRPLIQEKGLTKYFERVAMPLISVLGQMELNGITLHTDYLTELKCKLQGEIAEIDKQLEVYL
jgi:DNA polymerase-1